MLIIAEAVLHNFNQKWDNAIFEFDPIANTLVVGGEHLHTFLSDRYHTSQSNLLRTLKINKLVIKSKNFTNLENISMLYLASLDIRETSVTQIPSKHELNLISQIICRPDQFTKDELKHLPKHITLTVK